MNCGILFDLDGTLLDTLQDLTDSVNYAMDQFGCPHVTAVQVRAYLGNGARQLIYLSLPENRRGETDAVLAVYKGWYDGHCQIKTAPYGGIPQALEQLKGDFAVAVVSNKPDSAVKPLCAQYFPGLYALGEAAGCPRKPAPDMLYKAMDAIGTRKCIYVGDSEVDVLTAKNAGIPCVAVSWGFRDRIDLENAGAQYICDDPSNLPQLVERIAKDTYGK